MVKAVKTASVEWTFFHLCSAVEYPVPRTNVSVEEGVGEIFSYLCSLVMDGHVVKVISCLVCKHSKCSRVGWWTGNITGGISLISLSLNQGISSNT